MLLIRRSTVAIDMLSSLAIDTRELSLTRRLNTANSSAVKLHCLRKYSHSGSVNSVFMFKGSPLFIPDLSPL